MYDLVILMVRVKVKVGAKGQIVIPKMLRELLGIETRKHPSGANQLLAMAKHWMVPIS